MSAITLTFVPAAALTVTASNATATVPQSDGRFFVTETQSISDGSEQIFTYLADAGTDINAVATARAVALDAQFTAAAAAVPQSVSASQARSAIFAEGLKTAAEAAVAAASAAVQQLWYTAPTISRDDPNLIALGTAIGLTSAQIDTLFQEAATYPGQ